MGLGADLLSAPFLCCIPDVSLITTLVCVVVGCDIIGFNKTDRGFFQNDAANIFLSDIVSFGSYLL